ncbi:MAG: response regulator transcription factor [Acidimicrobiales bacterium]
MIADDSMLLREGLARLLGEGGVEVVALVPGVSELMLAVAEHEPDVAIIDIRMPPTFTHEGAEAALRLRTERPSLAILLLSQSLERRFAAQLAQEHPGGFGYLLKDRVIDVAHLVGALKTVTEGGTVLDPDVVAHLLGRRSRTAPLARLTPREREVLGLLAEGRSNAAISRLLHVNEKTVDTHISSVFSKLDLQQDDDNHRRVLAVLAWLGS